jgi:diguanylate cyclase (GGDEF)-like protein
MQTILYRSRLEDFNVKNIIQAQNSELVVLYKQLQNANEELKILAETDGLTGLYNRLMFDKLLKSQWKTCIHNSTPITLIMIDIDYFKYFNDNYGHQAGDNCIKEIAKVLSYVSKKYSLVVARYGGEEFSIIIQNLDTESAYSIGEEVRYKIENLNIPHDFSTTSKYVTISLGIYTTVPTNDLSIEKFLTKADNALYKAKDQNRNTIVVAGVC